LRNLLDLVIAVAHTYLDKGYSRTNRAPVPAVDQALAPVRATPFLTAPFPIRFSQRVTRREREPPTVGVDLLATSLSLIVRSVLS
jgi:hypothetical protein